MPDSFPELVIRSHDDLATVFRAIQQHLQISNAQLEMISGVAEGGVDKWLGPSRVKTIGRKTFDLLLGALGVRLRVEIDPETARLVRGRWIKRNNAQVRTSTRLSKEILERAKPLILSEVARKGWQTRHRQARANGHANGHGALK